MTDNLAMIVDLKVTEALEKVSYSLDLACSSPACVVCGPAVEAAAARARRKGGS
jgi:hypothetical protein